MTNKEKATPEAVAEEVKAEGAKAEEIKEDEMVCIKLPINPLNKGDDSLFVGVNGRSYQIKRGVAVNVPRAVAEVIEHSEAAKYKATEYTNRAEPK